MIQCLGQGERQVAATIFREQRRPNQSGGQLDEVAPDLGGVHPQGCVEPGHGTRGVVPQVHAAQQINVAAPRARI